MSDLIHCPTCQRPLSVPDELIGRPVKCPDCGEVFLTVQGNPGPGGAGPDKSVPMSVWAETVGDRTNALPEAYPQSNDSVVTAPGIALLVVGLLGFIAALFVLLMLVQVDEKELKAAMQRPAAGDADQEAFDQGFEIAMGPFGRVVHGIFTLVNLAIITGAVAILLRRFYVLAVLASILAMVNVDSCCCLLGMPVGLWSLIVLMRPDVKAMFH